ncbi:MAG: thioesterase, partial [Bacteroidales bacterium]|nr:thioesterase [Bacteroidales bacterium]
MNLEEYIGLERIDEKVVGENDLATFYGSGLIEVFSTPAMIAFAEYNCMMSVENILPEELSTVGTHVD